MITRSSTYNEYNIMIRNDAPDVYPESIVIFALCIEVKEAVKGQPLLFRCKEKRN